VAVLNGVNLDRFKPRDRTGWIHEALGIERAHRLIGMPAVLARWKGQPEVLEAFKKVRDDLPDVHLVFVGGSIYDTVAEREYGIKLKAMVEDASPRIHLLPFQQDVELAYPEFDLVMHYSVRPEPFGRIILEAMASEVPVVAANEGGPPEILGGGIGSRHEAGWLADPRNPAALAQVMRSAFGLPSEVLRSIGAVGRRRAEDFFSARRFAREVADVLHQTAAQARSDTSRS
jgi:glycosyltransferase involved in cell wall biosynthesis